MKIRQSREQGSVILVSMVMIVIIGITMTSYLEMVSNQNLSTMRSQQWNASLPIIEAGIEEALTHLYHNTDRATDGWTDTGAGVTKERVIGESKVAVTISPATPPIITAVGYVRLPLQTNYFPQPRAVRVTTKQDGLFVKGLVAKGAINMNGNNIRTDSFDSSDPNYSTGGAYDPAKAKDGGSVATNSSITNTFNIGNADIHGPGATGPGGSPTIGSNGGIGPKAWRDAGNNGVYPGWFTDDMNVSFPDVSAPFTGGAFTPTSGSLTGTNYTYLLGSGNYQLSSLSMSGQNRMLVNGNAILYVTGNVSLSGQSQIRIASGGSLSLYVGGASASLGGNGVANYNANATNFFYYGLPSNTSLSLSGNSSLTGVIYAPSAALTMNGGGSDTLDFSGASITGTVTMNGHYNFHYDESLGKLGGGRGFIVTSWNEVTSF